MSINIRSSSSKGQETKALNETPCRSWAEQVAHSECKGNNTSPEDSKSPERETSTNNLSNSSNSQDRDIKVEFIDDVNEQKYKRLVEEEKIKTPFKRRHETDSPSYSPTSSNSDVSSEGNEYKEEKRLRHSSQSSSNSNYVESDPAILSRRQKQIDYGKNTLAYDRYVEAVPRDQRTRDHPRTPNKYGRYSRRAFDGLIKIWRKQLHHYDPPNDEKEKDANDLSSEESDL